MADITARLPGDRAKILGLQSTVINMAYAAGPAIGGVCCDLYGVRTSFFIVGGAAILPSVGYSLLCVGRLPPFCVRRKPGTNFIHTPVIIHLIYSQYKVLYYPAGLKPSRRRSQTTGCVLSALSLTVVAVVP